MADITLPQGAPGIASFATETIGNSEEPRFGDAPASTTTVNVGPNVNLPLYAVVSYDGTTIALADQATAGSAYGILTAPVVTAAGENTTVDVYRSGHWDTNALVWDASFTTDEQKIKAAEGGASPMLLFGTKAHTSEAVVGNL